MLYNNGIESRDIWSEASRFFMKEKHKPQHMNLKKFYTDNKFGLLIDLRSIADQEMHGSGTRHVNTTDGAQLEIERKNSGTGDVNCHVYIISDSQFNTEQTVRICAVLKWNPQTYRSMLSSWGRPTLARRSSS